RSFLHCWMLSPHSVIGLKLKTLHHRQNIVPRCTPRLSDGCRVSIRAGGRQLDWASRKIRVGGMNDAPVFVFSLHMWTGRWTGIMSIRLSPMNHLSGSLFRMSGDGVFHPFLIWRGV